VTLNDICTILKATGYPVAYSHFTTSQTPPYIAYMSVYSSNLKADNRVYQKVDNLQIELYTAKKDLIAEKKLEDLLDQNEIAYESTETWIDSEKLFQKIYEVRLI
jgi:hypothetical protein